MGAALVHPAVQVELRRLHRRFQHQPVGAAGLRQALAHHPLEGLDQPADHPQFTPAEAGVPVQLGLAVDPPRQHRERRLHRLHIARVGQAVGHRAAVARVQRGERQAGLGAHLLQHLARMQLVLAGQDGGHRRAGQAGGLGHQGGGQRAELLMVRHHAGPATRPGAPRLCRRKALQVEADQPRIAGEREQVEPRFVELEGVSLPGKAQRVPVVVEQQADPGHASRASRTPLNCQRASVGKKLR